ncbi:hypothetical protein B6U60_10605, partial [Ligilactobacillus salivarius]
MDKLNGNQKLADAKDKAKQRVDNLPNLNEAQKKAAKGAIDKATDPAGVENSVDTAVAKDKLNKAINDGQAKKGTSAYYNGSDEKKQALDGALAKGQQVANDPDATQAVVNKARKAITDAMNALDGKVTDKTTLKNSVAGSDDVKNTNDYKYASDKARKDYDAAITNAQKVLDNKNATQNEVNTAEKAIEDAKDALSKSMAKAWEDAKLPITRTPVLNTQALTDAEKEKVKENVGAVQVKDTVQSEVTVDDQGNVVIAFSDGSKAKLTSGSTIREMNKNDLQQDIDDDEKVKNSDNYKDASDSARETYDAAIEAGKQVNSDSNATQEAINQAHGVIQKALQGLKDSAAKAKEKLNTNVDETPVGDHNKVDDVEKGAIAQAVADANKNNGVTKDKVTVDDQGNATVTFPDGSKAVVPASSTTTNVSKEA